MPRPRQLGRRRKAVANIRTVTRAMQMIATSRAGKMRTHAQAVTPAEAAVQSVLQAAVAAAPDDPHRLLRGGKGETCNLLLVTSDRGLCGAFNSAVLAAASQAAAQMRQRGLSVRVTVFGKRGASLVRGGAGALPAPVGARPAPPAGDLRSWTARLAESQIHAVLSGQVSAVYVASTRLTGRASHRPDVTLLIPLAPPPPGGGVETPCEFLPGLPAVLETLLPLAVRLTLYRLFAESAVAEQVARMTAMAAASQNANTMIRRLSQQINRARQSQITTELAEILGPREGMEESP